MHQSARSTRPANFLRATLRPEVLSLRSDLWPNGATDRISMTGSLRARSLRQGEASAPIAELSTQGWTVLKTSSGVTF